MTELQTRISDKKILDLVCALHEVSPDFEKLGCFLDELCVNTGSSRAFIAEFTPAPLPQVPTIEILATAGLKNTDEAKAILGRCPKAENTRLISDLPSGFHVLHKNDHPLGYFFLEDAHDGLWKSLTPILSGLSLGLFQRAEQRAYHLELEVLQEAFETTAEGFVIFDPEDRLHFCNGTYMDFYNLSREAMVIGTKFEDILRFGLERNQYAEAGQDAEDRNAWLAARLMVHKHPTHPLAQRLGDGRWLKINERRSRRGYTVGVRTDVTDFKVTEAALRKSEEEAKRLALVASKTQHSVKILNSAGYVEWVNDAFVQTTGYLAEDVIGFRFGELLQGVGSDPGTLSYFNTSIKAGKACKEVILCYKKDGTPFWHQVEIQPIFDDEGHLANFIAIGQDVTKEKTAELAIQRSEMKFRALVNLAPVGILQTSKEGRFVDCNETFERLSLEAKQQLTETEFGNIFSNIDDEKRQSYLADLQKQGSAGPMEIAFKTRKNQTLAIINSLLVDIPGGMPIIWTIVQDITEQKRVERLKSEFVAVVSHELRTPVTAMIGSLGLISSGVFGELTVKQQNLLDMAQKNAKRLKGMVNNILDAEKLESGELSVDMSDVDLVQLAQDTITEFTPYALDRSVSVVLDTSLKTGLVHADPLRLSQILLNLLSNAVNYSDENSEVALRVYEQDRGFVLAVKDTGTGIPEEARSKLFERFFQADSTDKRSKQGTGLGLAICQSLAEAHGSKIEVESEVGVGSTFSIYLKSIAM